MDKISDVVDKVDKIVDNFVELWIPQAPYPSAVRLVLWLNFGFE